MTDERLAELRGELAVAGYVVTTYKFWDAAAEAIRWMVDTKKQEKREAQGK